MSPPLGPPELVSDFSDFGRPQVLRDALQTPPGDSRLYLSPDGRHLFVWLVRQRRLLSFMRLPPDSRPLPGACLERSWPARAPALCGLLFLRGPGPDWLLSLVWRSGRTDVWSPPRADTGKCWELLRTLELCNSPRAGVVSVCCCGEELVWCEERPPSRSQEGPPSKIQEGPLEISPSETQEGSPTGALERHPSDIQEGPPSKPQEGPPSKPQEGPPSKPQEGPPSKPQEGPPSKPQDSSGLFTYCVCRRRLVVTDQQVTMGSMKIVLHHSPLYSLLCSHRHVFMVPDSGAQPLLVYSSVEDVIVMVTLPAGAIHNKSLAEGEMDFKKMVLEYAAFLSRQPPLEIRHMVVTGAGHLLLMTTAMQVYLVSENGSVRHILDMEIPSSVEAEIKMQIFGKTLACAMDTALYLIDINTGRLMAKQLMNAGELFFLKVMDTDDVQLLTKNGLYKVGSSISVEVDSRSEPVHLDMVYEEACKYYQKRSLSNAKLTVRTLKKEGMFQAPIILSAILHGYQQNGKSKEQKQYAELASNMNNELQSFISLELLKACIINASEADIEQYAEELVDHEITRLLQMDLDRDSLVYINTLFSSFPKSAWTSLTNNFQFQQDSDGVLVVRATADLWKKVLSPLPSGSRDGSRNGIYPLFEMICQSLCTFKPKWLPGFVQHAQDCSGLCWNFAAKDNSEGMPLYKRALSVLNKSKENTNIDLEVDLLLNSGRPQAVIQAIHILIGQQRWSRVMEETKRFSQLSPLITKDIFITLLVEFVNHRHLDPYLNQLCDICPEGLTATDLVRIVLQNLPKGRADPSPFARNEGAQLTVGLLKPLLNKVLQRQLGKDEISRLQTFPPVTPQRANKSVSQIPLVNGDNLSPTDIYATNSSESAPFSTVLQ